MEMTIQPLTDQQKADIKRLATAMREGAKIRTQVRSVLFRKDYAADANGVIGSCALGAAWEGSHPAFNPNKWLMNVEDPNTDPIGRSDIEKYFGGLNRMEIINPFVGNTHSVSGVIIDANDRKGWTREMIADWLDTLANG